MNSPGFFLHDVPFLRNLPGLEKEILLASARLKNYEKHSALLFEGDAADRFFVILSGWIKLSLITPVGEESVVELLTRGDVFGQSAIFDGGYYPHSAEAINAASVLEIPASLLKERAAKNPQMAARIMSLMADDINHLRLELEHMALLTAPQRVGCLLLQLSTGLQGTGGTFPFPFDKSLAALKLGMKPETFSRALVQLKSQGVTANGSEIRIESFQRLTEYCCEHCSAETRTCTNPARKYCFGSPSGCRFVLQNKKENSN